jgi:hypothetical protein
VSDIVFDGMVFDRLREIGDQSDRIASLESEIARLRLTDDERETIKRAIDSQQDRAAEMHSRSWDAAAIDEDCDTLRGLLERLG